MFYFYKCTICKVVLRLKCILTPDCIHRIQLLQLRTASDAPRAILNSSNLLTCNYFKLICASEWTSFVGPSEFPIYTQECLFFVVSRTCLPLRPKQTPPYTQWLHFMSYNYWPYLLLTCKLFLIKFNQLKSLISEALS